MPFSSISIEKMTPVMAARFMSFGHGFSSEYSNDWAIRVPLEYLRDASEDQHPAILCVVSRYHRTAIQSVAEEMGMEKHPVVVSAMDGPGPEAKRRSVKESESDLGWVKSVLTDWAFQQIETTPKAEARMFLSLELLAETIHLDVLPELKVLVDQMSAASFPQLMPYLQSIAAEFDLDRGLENRQSCSIDGLAFQMGIIRMSWKADPKSFDDRWVPDFRKERARA